MHCTEIARAEQEGSGRALCCLACPHAARDLRIPACLCLPAGPGLISACLRCPCIGLQGMWEEFLVAGGKNKEAREALEKGELVAPSPF